jgi:hypothetical protein
MKTLLATTAQECNTNPLFSYHCTVKSLVLATALITLATSAPVTTLDLDVTPQDIERALATARGSDRERATFHAPYIVKVNDPFLESVEVVSEYRRMVLLAEDRLRKGDRDFSYSLKRAQQALGPWHRRVSVIARLRFHPQNNYVDVPPADIVLIGAEAARIGVLREPILSLPSGNPGERLAVLGGVVEGSFDATSVGQGMREAVVTLDGKQLGSVKFDLGLLQ